MLIWSVQNITKQRGQENHSYRIVKVKMGGSLVILPGKRWKLYILCCVLRAHLKDAS